MIAYELLKPVMGFIQLKKNTVKSRDQIKALQGKEDLLKYPLYQPLKQSYFNGSWK